MRLELAFALSDVLHHLHFFGFVAFGGGGKIFKLDGGALGEVLSDLFSTGHERYGVKRWTVNLLNKSLAQKESRFQLFLKSFQGSLYDNGGECTRAVEG